MRDASSDSFWASWTVRKEVEEEEVEGCGSALLVAAARATGAPRRWRRWNGNSSRVDRRREPAAVRDDDGADVRSIVDVSGEEGRLIGRLIGRAIGGVASLLLLLLPLSREGGRVRARGADSIEGG
jgi:hypothetical protein